jgi:hypothetical protein
MTSPAERSDEPRTVVTAYRPKDGKVDELLACVRDHLPVLRAEGLATDRPALVLRAASGAVVEIFEWRSDAAIAQAHHNPTVLALWERFGACCDYVPLASLPEARQPFSPFERLDLSAQPSTV